MTERRLWIGAVAALIVFLAATLAVGNLLGEPRLGALNVRVTQLREGGPPADRWGDEELSIVGWYAELDADCEGDTGGADDSVAWLQRDCPLRALLPEQPPLDVTQAELEDAGIRLAAPSDNRFPSRAQPDGPNLRPVQLVFEGHFDDEAAARCIPDRRERCRNTFVVTDYDELVR